MEAHVTAGGEKEQGGPWTNEKHVRYLASMEAAFVRTMLETNSGLLPRLDRHLPDSSESTLDLKSSQFIKRRKHVNLPDINSRILIDVGRADRRTRRPPPNKARHEMLLDQVVPQLEKKSADKDEGEPSNNAAVTTINAAFH